MNRTAPAFFNGALYSFMAPALRAKPMVISVPAIPTEAPSILPAGAGSWQSPGIAQAKRHTPVLTET